MLAIQAIAQRLAAWKASGLWPAHPVGINLGKSKVTPLEGAPLDYANSFRAVRPYADFFVVNVSSPNTPNLRQLQDKEALAEILRAIEEAQAVATKSSKHKLQVPEKLQIPSPKLSGAKPIRPSHLVPFW